MGVSLSGGGLLVLAASNTYSGNTTVGAGTLSLANPLAVQNSTVTVTSSGNLSFAAGVTSPTVGGLAGAGKVALATAASQPVTLNVGANGQSTNYSGNLSGPGGLTKWGGGTLVLSASQSYVGPTVVVGGMLKLQIAASAPPVAGYAEWFDASTAANLTLSGSNVVQWNDLSGNGHSATTQTPGVTNPTYVPNALNGLGAIQFIGGTNVNGAGNTNLLFNEDNDIRTVFSVFKGASFLMTDTNTYDFHRYQADNTDANAPLWDGPTSNNWTSPYITGGTTTVNGVVADYSVTPMPTNLNNGFNLIAVQTTGNVSANGFNRDRIYNSGDQEQAEVIIYDQPLSTSEVQQIEAYLNFKWSLGISGLPSYSSSFGNNLLPATTAMTVAASATFDMSGCSQQVASLAGAGSVINSSTAIISVLTVNPSSSVTFSGTIAGGGTLGAISLVVNGSGTQVLAASNTYTGGSTLVAGLLCMNNPAAIGTGPLTLAGGNFDNTSGSAIALSTNNPQNWNNSFTFLGSSDLNLGSGSVTLGANCQVTVGNGNLTVGGPISGGFGLTKAGSGTLILNGQNSYLGGTVLSAGTLLGNTTSLQGSIADNATLVFNQAADGTFAGSITSSGGLAKIGAGMLTLGGADTFSASGGIAINQGTLAAPYGISHGGSPITVAAGATLLAGGEIDRAVSGNGTVTAAGELIIGNAAQPGQFNQGGPAGSGGTLNVGGNAVVILSSGTAVLGSQTNIAAGGSLTALNGIQLGNPSSVDATKVLTATGAATINGNFINNGVVNGPTGSGQELTFTQFVKGAGSTTGNVEYQASYQPSNSPNAVSVQNVLLDSTSTLIMELAGVTPGSGYDQLDISGEAVLDGTLDVTLIDGFTPSAGEGFDIFDGPATGNFNQVDLPALGNGLQWDTSQLYASGEISVVPEPSTLALLGVTLCACLACRRRQKRAAPAKAGTPARHSALN